MKNLRNLALLLLTLAVSQNAMAWGKWGHRISAYIAEQHLTEKAASECRRYLKHTLPYHASWQDYWRNCEGFGEVCTAHAHYVNEDFSLRGKGGNPDRDPVSRIDCGNESETPYPYDYRYALPRPCNLSEGVQLSYA